MSSITSSTDATMPSDDEMLEEDSQECVETSVERLTRDLITAQGVILEVESRGERQVGDLQNALKKVANLTKEGSEKERIILHLQQQLAQQAQRDTGDSDLKSKLQHVEARCEALTTAAELESQRVAKLERERDGLRLKVQSLLEVSQQCQALGISVSSIAASCEATAPLTPSKKASQNQNYSTGGGGISASSSSLPKGGGISLVKAAASRVALLEAELESCRKSTAEYKILVESLKESNATKDADLATLRAQTAAAREAADFKTFENLSQHIGKLSAELQTLRNRAIDPKALAVAEEGWRAAESRASAAESSRDAVAAQLYDMRRELSALTKDSETAACAEGRMAKLRVAVDEAKTQEAAARAAMEMAEGRAAELQDRLERRDAALQKAQARCRSVEAELHRLRQLQGLKKSAAGGHQGGKNAEQGEKNEEIGQLKSQCAAMAAHLQEAMRLQAAAVSAAAAAAAERDEATQEVACLTAELEDVQMQMQEAAAAAAAVRQRLASASAHSNGGGGGASTTSPMLLSSSTSSTSTSSLASESSAPQNLLSVEEKDSLVCELHAQLEASGFEVAELQLEAAQERQKAETLQQCCAQLEARIKELENQSSSHTSSSPEQHERHSPPSTSSPSSSPSSSLSSCGSSEITGLRCELEQRRKECQDLSTAGAQADAAMNECLQQLRAVSAELHESRGATAAAQEALYDRDTHIASLQEALQALHNERGSLHAHLASVQAAAEEHIENLSAAMTAEREAAARDFDAMRANIQVLSKQYQDLTAHVAAVQSERDAAVHMAESAATHAAFHEQATRAKDVELQECLALCMKLTEDNRQLQEAVMALQREVTAHACQMRFGNEREQAALQRRIAAAESGTALLEAKFAETTAEAAALQARLAAEAVRAEELEALLVEERKRQFQEESEETPPPSSNSDAPQQVDSPVVEAVMSDAMDDALLQRLSELEAECSSLKAEKKAAGNRRDAAGYSSDRIDLLAELAQVSGQLQEEQRRREELQAVVHTALENRAGGASSSSSAVLQQLQGIAQGLQGLGNSSA